MLRKYLIPLVYFLLIFVVVIFDCFPASAAQDQYPQLAISGHKGWNYSKFDVSPTKNYWLALSDHYYSRGGASGPWSEELQLFIEGDLSKDVNIRYGLRQNPIAPDRYDLTLAYDDYSLLIGDPQEGHFSGQEYALQDHANGIGIGAEWNKIKAFAFSGAYPGHALPVGSQGYVDYKIYRNPQYAGNIVPSYGIDDPYQEYLGFDLGRIDVLEETIEIFIGKRKLIKNADYYFDQPSGSVLICSSHKNEGKAKVSFQLDNGEEKEAVFDLQADGHRQAFSSPDFRIINDSEIVTIDGMRLYRDLDYRVNYNIGLFIMNEPLYDDAEVRIDYDYTYGASLYASEAISGQSGLIFSLSHKYIARFSETVTKNDQLLDNGTDYTIDYTNGAITFVLPLVNSDVVEIAYVYSVIRQNVMAVNAEYELNNRSRIGSSIIAISPSSGQEELFNAVSPSTYMIWNLYNKTVLDKETFLNAEFSLSSRDVDYRNSATIEADSAMKLYARTRLLEILGLSATYRKIGSNFASLRKVKSGTGRRKEDIDVTIDLLFPEDLSSKIGFGTVIEQEGASPEARTTLGSYRLNQRLTHFWENDYEIKRSYTERQATTEKNETETLYFHSKLDLLLMFPAMSGYVEDSKIIYKYLNIYDDDRSGTAVNNRSRTSNSELSLKLGVLGNLSAYLAFKVEDEKNLVVNGIISNESIVRTIPYTRVAYKIPIFDIHNFELYYDYSPSQGRGSVNYDKNEQAVGLICDLPVENPVLSKFNFGAVVKTTDYKDLNDSSNDYHAFETVFQGTLVF